MISALWRILGSARALAIVWGVTLVVLLAGDIALTFLPGQGASGSGKEADGIHKQPVPAETLAGLRWLAAGAGEKTGGEKRPGQEGASPTSSRPHEAAALRSETAVSRGEAEADSPRLDEQDDGRAAGTDSPGLQEPAAGAGATSALRVAVAAGPDPDLLEASPYGPLPVRAADGRSPWRAYARPFLGDPDKPRIAIIITKLGLSRTRTERAIAELPPEVSLAFSPYGRGLEDWGRKARKAGHEVLLMVPMEPIGYPDNDPGPLALMTMRTPAENVDRLHRVLGRMTAYVGIVSEMGSRFTASPQALAPIMSDLSRRGLMVVDSRTTARSVLADEARAVGLPVAVNDRIIDNIADPDEIERYLRELETLALRRGYALGMGRAYPVTIARIRAWAAGLAARGFVLAPVSALARMDEEAP